MCVNLRMVALGDFGGPNVFGMTKQQTAPVSNSRQPMLTVQEVAAYLQVPEGTVYRWNTRGTGPRPWRVGRHVRYRLDEVDAWVQNGNPPHRAI